MKKKKNIILALALFALFILIAGGAYSYAKYFTKADGNIGSNIKRWDIKINNESIQNKTTLTNKITATFPNESGHVKENKIAPGVEGYFEITIDYSGVDLDFTYDLSIAGDAVPDIKLTKLVVDDEEIAALDHVEGTINIDGVTTSKVIKAYVKWNDGDGSTLSNEEDTEVTINNDSIDFDIQMTFTQANPTP